MKDRANVVEPNGMNDGEEKRKWGDSNGRAQDRQKWS